MRKIYLLLVLLTCFTSVTNVGASPPQLQGEVYDPPSITQAGFEMQFPTYLESQNVNTTTCHADVFSYNVTPYVSMECDVYNYTLKCVEFDVNNIDNSAKEAETALDYANRCKAPELYWCGIRQTNTVQNILLHCINVSNSPELYWCVSTEA